MESKVKRERLSIDVLPIEHKQIRVHAALTGKTIKEYVLGAIKERFQKEIEDTDLSDMTLKPTSVLKELWDNKKDSAYDEL
jgi:hypothetical protein